MLKTWIAASAMLAFVGASNMGASAQSPAPAAAAIAPTAAPPLVDAARFTESASAYSATLSPDGNLIAYIERTSDGERLVVMDVAAQRSVVVQSVPQNVGALDWVSWKGNDRLMRDALNAAGRPTRLVTLQGEGHMWADWSNDNRLLLMKESEAFLAQQIGNTSAVVTAPAPH